MRTSKYKVGKDMKNLINTINQLDLTDIKKKKKSLNTEKLTYF